MKTKIFSPEEDNKNIDTESSGNLQITHLNDYFNNVWRHLLSFSKVHLHQNQVTGIWKRTCTHNGKNQMKTVRKKVNPINTTGTDFLFKYMGYLSVQLTNGDRLE